MEMKEMLRNYFQGNYRTFYEKYLQNIQKLKGEEFKAVCPFHDDTEPSLNFNNQNGQFYCHGCSEKGDSIHFYAASNGLDTKTDFRKILKGIADDFNIAWQGKNWKLVKTYDYTNVEGNLLYQVCRYEPKDFKQRQPGPNGTWIWNLKGIEPVLYNLPQVIKASEVFVVEGEKDCGTLMDLGLTATTCPMGVKKWREGYNEPLKGKDIVLIPDNDNEGREHMAQIAISLNGQAKSLKLIELSGIPSKGDITDFVTKFDDNIEAAQSLSVLIEGTGIYKPQKPATYEDVILEAKDFTALELPPKQILLNPWLTEQSITLISGWRGTGKTWLALSILDAVSKREPFGPWEPGASVPCLFLDGEMPAQDIIERANDLDINSIYIYSDSYANSRGLPKANLLHEEWRKTIKRILIAKGIKLFVLDNLGSLAGGIDENVKRDWDPINAWLLELRFAGIATIMLHHTGKEGGQRGTSAREDNIDISIMLDKPFDYSPEDGCRFIMHFGKTRVRTRDLKLIPPMHFQLRENDTGQLIWTFGNVKKETRKGILEMLDAETTYDTICEDLNISKSYISKIKKAAISDGHLSTKGKLTQTGLSFIQDD